ncbi:MAG: catalase [Oscillospiraceae bacterium]|nr:catalase [Oscillospiraceae bacterium]
MKAWKHFCTITKHRWAVRKHCFRVGMYWRGLVHDLSKYSPTEFMTGARYYQGTRSPNSRERELIGYSAAWMHHKGRNKHHYEYWTDLDLKTRKYVAMPMPRKFFAEMIMDRIAACKIYHGKAYTDADALEYLDNSSEGRDNTMMNPQTKEELRYILVMLKEKGEKETFSFIRNVVLTGKPIIRDEKDEDAS